MLMPSHDLNSLQQCPVPLHHDAWGWLRSTTEDGLDSKSGSKLARLAEVWCISSASVYRGMHAAYDLELTRSPVGAGLAWLDDEVLAGKPARCTCGHAAQPNKALFMMIARQRGNETQGWGVQAWQTTMLMQSSLARLLDLCPRST